MKLVLAVLSILIASVLGVSGLAAQTRSITLASTTSTANSGLFAHILPMFEAQTGIAVRVLAVGTGQALRIARAGDADVLLVHHRPSEDAFVADGDGVERFDLMFNDFVLIGPVADPAGIAGMTTVEALTRIVDTRASFTSRSDDSGTHKKEMELWAAAGLTPSGPWYRELGAGMGATLNIASQINAYVLTDRATWVAFRNKGSLDILAQDDPVLLNPYGVILVNPERHTHVRATDGQKFIDWLISDVGQAAIGNFRVDGQQLFFPSAGDGS